MDTNRWRTSQVGEAAMDAGDWRSQLQADLRQGIVNKIMDTLKRHLPFSGQDGLQELSKIAVRFEEKIYTAATSQSDYLQKISLKMLIMETKSQNSMGNPLQSNSAGNSNGPPDPGSFGMQPQVPNQGMQPQVPSQASLDSSAQTGYANGGDWLEEVYQKMQQMGLQQQSNPLQQDMQQRLQASGQISGTMLHAQNVMDQQKQLYQSQRPLPETSLTSLDSSAQTGDWQEEVYQKIKIMKEMYLLELSEMHQKIATKLQQHDSLPQQPRSEQLEKLKFFKTMLERLISVLQISKSNIPPGLKERLGLYEKQIVNFINTNRPRKQGPPLQQGQLPPPLM